MRHQEEIRALIQARNEGSLDQDGRGGVVRSDWILGIFLR